MLIDPLQHLFEQTQLLSYKANEVIARSDDVPKYIYYIKSGFVRVYSINSRGEEYLHIIYCTDELFPIVSLNGKVQRGVFYEALEGVKVHRLSSDSLLSVVQDKAALSFALTQHILRQFNLYVDRVDNLVYKFGRERLVYRIIFMASRFGKQTQRGLLIDLPITQKTLGSSINLSRETVARELRRLETRGLVAYEDRRILILDIIHLCDELKDPSNPDYWGLKR